MSFKKKLATAVATAGLLAGIFGSTLAPVAQGSSWNVSYAKTTFASNFEGSFQGAYYLAETATGSASNPWVMYAPYTNDGGALGTGAIDTGYTVCSYIDETDLVTLSGDYLSDSDDVSASVTATNGLLIYGEDNNAISTSSEESDYATSYTDNNVTSGIAVCFAPSDDDDAFDSVVTLKVNGTTVGSWTIRVLGPGQSMTLTDNTGGWIAMDHTTIATAFTITFLDKAGKSLSALRSLDAGTDGDQETLIESYWLDGYEANGDSNLEYAVDVIANGEGFSDDLSGYDSLAEGDRYSRIDIDSTDDLCDSDRDEVGASHTVYAIMDYEGGGEISSSDKKTNGVTVKCSDDGFFAEITGWDFGGATTVEQGDTIPMYLTIQDGSGNPMGLGSNWDLYFNGFDEWNGGYPYFEELGDPVYQFSPWHTQSDDADYYHYAGAMVEMEDPDDGNTVCGAPDTEDGDTWEEGEYFNDFLVAGLDNSGAGKVLMCYTASVFTEDLGQNWLKARAEYPWTDNADLYLDRVPKSFFASITVVKPGAGTTAAFGTTVSATAAGKVTVAGPVGAKVTFVVENSRGVVRTYTRVIGASGKASYKIKNSGTFYVYAMYGDELTAVKKIRVR
ncbi:MAG: hypothetical protein ACO3C4_05010 [Candidatus Limnocylindrus sp.]